MLPGPAPTARPPNAAQSPGGPSVTARAGEDRTNGPGSGVPGSDHQAGGKNGPLQRPAWAVGGRWPTQGPGGETKARQGHRVSGGELGLMR